MFVTVAWREQCCILQRLLINKGKTMALEAGSKAPAFNAVNEKGEKVSLKDYKGKKVVLYFYPEDDTETCTAQACSFRDAMQRITAHDAVVIGVSPNDEHSHQKFIGKYQLNFHLLADPQRKLCERYDVWAQKTMFGHTYMGVIRTTYIIDAKGIIRKVFNRVRVPGHADAVIAALEALT